MIFSEEINNQPVGYPKAFGITLTPLLIGVFIGLLGVLAAAFSWNNDGATVLEKYNQLKTEETEKMQRVRLEQDANYQRKVNQTQQEIDQAKKLQQKVYSLFANDRSADTLLLDINKIAKAQHITLTQFSPEGQPVTISDGSLGHLVDNKLKRKSFTVKAQGNFIEIHDFINGIEKLQPLLLIKNFKATNSAQGDGKLLYQLKPILKDGKVTGYEQLQKKSKVDASFRLDLISPLSPEEIAKLPVANKK